MLNTNRKFKFTAAVFVASTAALFFDKLAGGEYVTLVTLMAGIYTSGNVTQKHVQARSDG
jgi:hypothetical protein